MHSYWQRTTQHDSCERVIHTVHQCPEQLQAKLPMCSSSRGLQWQQHVGGCLQADLPTVRRNLAL